MCVGEIVEFNVIQNELEKVQLIDVSGPGGEDLKGAKRPGQNRSD